MHQTDNNPSGDRPHSDSTIGNHKEFPCSEKVYLEGRGGVQVPARKISLSGGESPLYVYDTSGPKGHDIREGLPKVRKPWILARNDVVEVPQDLKHNQKMENI